MTKFMLLCPNLLGSDMSLAALQKLQPSGLSNSTLGISAQYSLAEHYLHAFTPVAKRLLLGSTKGLEDPHLLADHRVSHVILLCCGPEVMYLEPCLTMSLQAILRQVDS